MRLAMIPLRRRTLHCDNHEELFAEPRGKVFHSLRHRFCESTASCVLCPCLGHVTSPGVDTR